MREKGSPCASLLGGVNMPPTARILVIEDDVNIRDVTVEALEFEGYAVRGADCGTTALRLLDTWSPHVILTDVRMPDMDGWDFLSAYRQRPRPHAPIVVF